VPSAATTSDPPGERHRAAVVDHRRGRGPGDANGAARPACDIERGGVACEEHRRVGSVAGLARLRGQEGHVAGGVQRGAAGEGEPSSAGSGRTGSGDRPEGAVAARDVDTGSHAGPFRRPQPSGGDAGEGHVAGVVGVRVAGSQERGARTGGDDRLDRRAGSGLPVEAGVDPERQPKGVEGEREGGAAGGIEREPAQDPQAQRPAARGGVAGARHGPALAAPGDDELLAVGQVPRPRRVAAGIEVTHLERELRLGQQPERHRRRPPVRLPHAAASRVEERDTGYVVVAQLALAGSVRGVHYGVKIVGMAQPEYVPVLVQHHRLDVDVATVGVPLVRGDAGVHDDVALDDGSVGERQ
jgi:hypothetical protein